MEWLAIVVGVFVALLLLLYLIEALRRQPTPPTELHWAPGVPIEYVEVNGIRLRYVVTGQGPTLVLLHTLRTQLDNFRKVIGELSKDFQVYAFDLPGHGYSDIPEEEYTPEFFAKSVRGFLETLDVTDGTIVGESIGGALGLLLAAEHNPRVRKVIAINSYDYGRGRGITRGSLFSKLIFALTNIPVVGGMVWRMRWYGAFATIIKGSVHDDASLPQGLVRKMREVGNRRNHYRAFMSLIAHFPKWEELRSVYGSIEIPVLMVYGEHDWSYTPKRESNRDAIPGAVLESVPGAGHLLSLDTPEATIRAVRELAG